MKYTDNELNEKAAKAMGWRFDAHGGHNGLSIWFTPEGIKKSQLP